MITVCFYWTFFKDNDESDDAVKNNTENKDIAVSLCHCQKVVLKISAVSLKRFIKVLIKLKFKLYICIIKLKLKITVSDDNSDASHCKLT